MRSITTTRERRTARQRARAALLWSIGLLTVTATGLTADATAPTALAPFLNSLPVVSEHHYRMAGRIRPLLFWMGKDNVGGASIVWRGDTAGERAYELLIGSDPKRAPRAVNRWGYIAERVGPSHATLLGVMKDSKEESLADATANVDKEAHAGAYTYKAIQSTIGRDRAEATIATIRVETDFTYHDAAPLLRLVQATTPGLAAKSAVVTVGTRPGFLVAVAEVVHGTVLARQNANRGSSPAAPRTVPYIYNGKMYDLLLQGSTFSRAFEMAGRTYTDVIRSEFEVRNRATGKQTYFELVYGTDGNLAEIPIRIKYRPKWWIETELDLDDAESF